jgi:hypothetical protein
VTRSRTATVGPERVLFRTEPCLISTSSMSAAQFSGTIRIRSVPAVAVLVSGAQARLRMLQTHARHRIGAEGPRPGTMAA